MNKRKITVKLLTAYIYIYNCFGSFMIACVRELEYEDCEKRLSTKRLIHKILGILVVFKRTRKMNLFYGQTRRRRRTSWLAF